MKKNEILKKEIEFKCYKCSGSGILMNENNESLNCLICDGTGIYKETYYYVIENKKQIAIDMDTLK